MDLTCDACGADVLEIDVKCGACGRFLASTGAHRMLGRVVLGQYEITDILGQGGMSVVYKARHQMTDQEVALKVLPPELAAHSQVKSRFLEEGRALAQLDHPNIVHLYNFGQEDGCLVLAMQYIHGVTFERMIIDAEMLDWTVTTRVAIDVLRALEFAHGRGVIHRDMKPSNILVRDTDGAATVMDFGIAKMTTSTRLTATGQTMGTVRYMSPEQVRGQPVDERTDLYSLGVTIYEAVCGDTPFDGDTHFEIMSKHLHEKPRPPSLDGVPLPAAFEEVLMRAMSKRPDDRFPNAAMFRSALEPLLDDTDLGRAETLKMSRAHLASMASRGRSAAETARATPPQLADDQRDVPTHAPAGSSAPAGAAPAAPVGDERSVELVAARGGRAGLWIGLAGAAVAAAAAAAFVATRETSPAPEPQARPSAAEVRAPPARWPDAFEPPDVALAARAEYPEVELRVRAPEGWEPARIRAMVDDAHEQVSAFVARGKSEPAAIPRQPLSVIVVPQLVFCDRRVYDPPPATQPVDCNLEYVYFRPYEKTLLVLDSEHQIEDAILDGIAISLCTHHKNCVSLDELHAWLDARDKGRK